VGGITNIYAMYVTVVGFLTISINAARNKQYKNYYIITKQTIQQPQRAIVNISTLNLLAF
jgi:hypothetical protein